MQKKLLGKGDLIVLRDTSLRGVWITPYELKTVVALVGEVAYTLYTFYRTFPFAEDAQIQDINVASEIGWTTRKVQRYRKILEAAQLYCSIRYGTKADGVTKLFVGQETVALFNAGLPADVLNPKALHKLKQKFSIKDTPMLISNVNKLVYEFERNPSEYT